MKEKHQAWVDVCWAFGWRLGYCDLHGFHRPNE